MAFCRRSDIIQAIIFRDFVWRLQVDPADFKTVCTNNRPRSRSKRFQRRSRPVISRTSNDVDARRSPEASRYAEIIYACSTVSASKLRRDNIGLLSGQLTPHGATHDASLQCPRARRNQWAIVCVASGECSVTQTAYGIKPVSAVGGRSAVKDDASKSLSR